MCYKKTHMEKKHKPFAEKKKFTVYINWRLTEKQGTKQMPKP